MFGWDSLFATEKLPERKVDRLRKAIPRNCIMCQRDRVVGDIELADDLQT